MPLQHNRPSHTPPATPRIPQPDSLETELARIRKEVDQVKKIHQDLKTRINSDCEKEIEEIHRKYNTLRHDAETSFVHKQETLDTFHNKVYRNMILAEVFRFKCTEPIQVGSHSSALPLAENYQFVGELRATTAPQHQSFRPSPPGSVPNHHYSSSAVPTQQSPSIPTTRPPGNSSGSSLTAGGFSVSHNSSLMHEMPRRSNNGPSLNLGLTLDKSESSEMAARGTLWGSATRVGDSAEVICLSDDD